MNQNFGVLIVQLLVSVVNMVPTYSYHQANANLPEVLKQVIMNIWSYMCCGLGLSY